MKFIRIKNGYVNAKMIESLEVIEKEDGFDLMAYTVGADDYTSYLLGHCKLEDNAYLRLGALAELLAKNDDGVFDAMALWSTDEGDDEND